MERQREGREKTNKHIALGHRKESVGRERTEEKGKKRESNKTVFWAHRWASGRPLLK